MEPSTKPLFSPARIVALVLIALALAGLAFLRVSSGSSTVSVPEGAHAGQLTLHSCTYCTERGDYAADCGTLIVPENRHDSNSRLIALPVKRIRALSSKPREPVFRLQGGPGLTNMDFPAASRYANDRDVVLIGYRGVDGSQSLQCHEAVSAMKNAHDFLGTSFYDAYEAGLSECAARPLFQPPPETRPLGVSPPPPEARRRPGRLLGAGAGGRLRGCEARPRLR